MHQKIVTIGLGRALKGEADHLAVIQGLKIEHHDVPQIPQPDWSGVCLILFQANESTVQQDLQRFSVHHAPILLIGETQLLAALTDPDQYINDFFDIAGGPALFSLKMKMLLAAINENIHLRSQLEQIRRNEKFQTAGTDAYVRELIEENERLKRKIRTKDDAEKALKLIYEGLSGASGQDFFRKLVRYLSDALNLDLIYAGIFNLEKQTYSIVASSIPMLVPEGKETSLESVPESRVMKTGELMLSREQADMAVHISKNMLPQENWSMLSIPLLNSKGGCIGTLSVLDKDAGSLEISRLKFLKIFALRAGTEFERMNHEVSLQQSKQRYHAFVAQSTEGIWRMELREPISTRLPVDKQVDQIIKNAFFDECNDAAAKMFGLNTGSELHGKKLREIFNSQSPEAFAHLRRQFYEFIRNEYLLTNAILKEEFENGSHKIFSQNVTGIIEDEKLTRIWGVQRDITEQLHAQEKLKKSERKFRKLFENISDALIITDEESNIEACNLAAIDLFKMSRYRLMNSRFTDLVHPDDVQDLLDFLENLEKSGKVTGHICRILRSGSSIRFVELNSTNLRGHDEWNGYEIMIRDITEEREVRQQLEEINKELETFIYKASHDLKGPLASTLGLIQLAERKIKDQEALSYFGMIRKSNESLNNILHDLLKVTRIKQEQVICTEFSLKDLLDDVIRGIREQYNPDDFHFNLDLQLDHDRIYSDYTFLREILVNLLENSVKFRRRHSNVSSYVKIVARENFANYEFEIEDNGMGIDKAVLNRVFEMFFRGAFSENGSGLGLYIVKNAVKKLKGKVEVADTGLMGTTMKVVIPLPRQQAKSEKSTMAI